MRTRALFATAATLLVGTVAQGQVRITSLNSNGTLVWTNSAFRGAYDVEKANSPIGPWTPLTSVIDTNTARTNPITAQIPLTNSQEYYRVGWTVPDSTGVWDYQAHDTQGTLVVTGQLTITSTTLTSSNDPSDLRYSVLGNYNLQYAGPPTNNLSHLGPHIGTGNLSGSFQPSGCAMIIQWPQYYVDYNIRLSRDVWANTYTGRWLYVTVAGAIDGGTFRATKD